MMIEIDFYSHNPIHAQIVAQIKHLIATGELTPGERLPTLRQLATELQINFTTVARAYRKLDAESLISTQHGRGTYILGLAAGMEKARLEEQSLEDLTRVYISKTRSLGFDDLKIMESVQKLLRGNEV
jgi:GntR family transcriptional regulator